MIYTRKAVNYEDRGNWQRIKTASNSYSLLFKEYVDASFNNISIPTDNMTTLLDNLNLEMSQDKKRKYLPYFSDFKLQIEQMFRFSFRNFTCLNKVASRGNNHFASFAELITANQNKMTFQFNNISKFTETREFVKGLTARHDHIEVTPDNRLLKIGSNITFDNLKFIYLNYQIVLETQITKDELLQETSDMMNYLFQQNIISLDTYNSRFNPASPSLKNELVVNSIIGHINIMIKIMMSIDEKNILIDNTDPYLLNLDLNSPLKASNGTFLNDFDTNFINCFAYRNNDSKIETPSATNRAFFRKFNQLNLLTQKTEVSEQEGFKVFSKIPKNILDQLTDQLIIPSYLPIDMGLHPTFSKHKQDPRTTASDIQVSQFGDIAFVGDLQLNFSDNDLFSLNESIEVELPFRNYTNDHAVPERNRSCFQNLLNEKRAQDLIKTINIEESLKTFINSKRKIKTFVINKLLVGNTESFEWSVQELTPSQVESKHGFIPVMFKIKYDDKETLTNCSPQKTGYYLILASLHNYATFDKYTRCQKEILFFAEHIANPELALFFENKELYLENRKKRAGGYDKYADNYSHLKNLFSEELTLQNYINTDDQNYNNILRNLVKEEFINLAIAKPKIDDININKLELARNTVKQKLNDAIGQIITNAKEQVRAARLINDFVQNVKLHKEEIERKQRNIENLQDQILERKSALHTLLKEQNKSDGPFKKKDTYMSAMQSLTKDWITMQSKYQEELQKAIAEGRFESNPYIMNLAQNNIHIISVAFKDGLVIQSGTDQETILRSRKVANQPIVSAKFIVDKVVKIKVDGKENQCVYGGPYILTVTEQSLQVSLLNRSSLFGCLSNGDYKIHPHTATFSYNSNKQDFLKTLYETSHRACLGESAPYIYNACKTGDLTMLIVNCLVWLSSANSADMWGRSWTYFPKKYNDSGFEFETPESIANEIFENIEEDEVSEDLINEALDHDDDECDHRYEDGVCVDCGDECDHENHTEDGYCVNCNMYNEWADTRYDDEDDEDHQEIQPQQANNYTPYVALTTNNNNNNQG